MKHLIFLACLAMCTSGAFGTSDPTSSLDPLEVRFNRDAGQLWDHHYQQVLLEQPAWQSFRMAHPKWNVYFNEANGLPERAFGDAIATQGATPAERAIWFLENEASGFGINTTDLELAAVNPTDELVYIHFNQRHNGIKLLDAKLTVKLWNDQVIMWGANVYDASALETVPTVSPSTALALAQADMVDPITDATIEDELAILPVRAGRSADMRLVYEALVKVESTSGIPAHYYTLIDAHSGEVLYRQNRVHHFATCPKCTRPGGEKPVRTMGLMTVSGTVSGEVYTDNPFGEVTTEVLPYLEMSIGGQPVAADVNGAFTSTATGPVNVSIPLEGRWSTVFTNGNTPQLNTTLAEGNNAVTHSDAESTIRERSAYRSTSLMHDHVVDVLPGFTGMNFSMPTNIDVAGECNAFYDGTINFYNIGGGCNATSLIADVVYHEYGHGVNNLFYQANGGFFQNGAMNEGYADIWAISLTDNPNLGQGFYTDDVNGIRRYDIDPKVYPQDIVGEVHADGEIICGAWYDTHLLMGADWDLTMDLFAQAFPGLQADTFNGNEGVAYTNVLLDVLQADDDNGDLSDGTPNGFAIVEGFDLHGITLLASAVLEHDEILSATEDETITLEAILDVNFPFDQYLESGKVFYQINNSGTWNEADLVEDSGDLYIAELPAQPLGTVIEYYLGVFDIYENLTNVQPIGAAEADPNLPYYVIVGLDLVGVHDNDTSEEWGPWETGVAGDLATTGEWEVEFPIGSFSEPGDLSTVVAPYYEHTGGEFGELCFLTGQSPNANGGIGENDVDGGHTTLRSPVMDLSDYEMPVLSYWRWYVNGPAGGANPGQDWWHVQVSDDGGNSWVYLENTRTQDISWRRKAFRVEDYVQVNDQFRIQMIASDSTFVGQNLDGGSLVEAAVDDVFLWDIMQVGVEESSDDLSSQWSLFPNPASAQVTFEFGWNAPSDVTVEIINPLGAIVHQEVWAKQFGEQRMLDISSLPNGFYQVRLTRGEAVSVKPLQVLR